MDTILTSSQQKLVDFMSDISERGYYAGWMMNLEYVLWDALVNGERLYGHYFITQDDIAKLILLSKQSDSWIYCNNNFEETAMPIEHWKQKFEADVIVNPRLVKG